MEIVGKDKFDKAEKLPKVVKNKKIVEIKQLSESEFNTLLETMQNPVEAQQHLAVQVKNYLDQRIKMEMEEKGFLSDHTRRWVESYNQILEKIQKALYGDKSVNLHMHKIVSHSEIAARMREVSD